MTITIAAPSGSESHAYHRVPFDVPFDVTAHYQGRYYQGRISTGVAALEVARQFVVDYAATSATIAPCGELSAELFGCVDDGSIHVIRLMSGEVVELADTATRLVACCGRVLSLRDVEWEAGRGGGIPCSLCLTAWAHRYNQIADR